MNPLTRRQTLAGAATTALLTATESFAMRPKDLIIFNAKVTTLDRANPVAEAVAIRDGKFLSVGSEAEARAAAGSNAEIIDAGGRRLIPGLIDSHIHPVVGDYTPRQQQLNWIDSTLHGGVTTAAVAPQTQAFIPIDLSAATSASAGDLPPLTPPTPADNAATSGPLP